jgi:hypothetical protein
MTSTPSSCAPRVRHRHLRSCSPSPLASCCSRPLTRVQPPGDWHEQSVLDPDVAEETAVKLEKELAHAESLLRELLARETEIASELKALTTDGR